MIFCLSQLSGNMLETQLLFHFRYTSPSGHSTQTFASYGLLFLSGNLLVSTSNTYFDSSSSFREWSHVYSFVVVLNLGVSICHILSSTLPRGFTIGTQPLL